jgi:hypothetical protein
MPDLDTSQDQQREAYGVNAPFKPTTQGASMRFIRKPNPSLSW